MSCDGRGSLQFLHSASRLKVHMGLVVGDMKGNTNLPWPLKSWPELFLRPGLHHFPSLITKVSHMTKPGIRRKVCGVPPRTALSTSSVGGVSVPSQANTRLITCFLSLTRHLVERCRLLERVANIPQTFQKNADLCRKSD